jgi:hypothetical protein
MGRYENPGSWTAGSRFALGRTLLGDAMHVQGAHVLEAEGPLEEGWEQKVETFAARIPAA